MRSDLSRVLLAAGAAAAIAFTSADVSAFCRTTTISNSADFASGPCGSQGLPLYHESRCVPYHLLAQESPQLPNAILSDAIARAFATWSAPNDTCSPGITGIELAPTDATTIVNYVLGQRENNVFGVRREPRPHSGLATIDTLALSTLTFNPATGQIYDADMEITSEVVWSSSDTPDRDGYDIQAVMTHEVGHVLGLAHSTKPEAAMAAAYTPGSKSQRALADDDKKGICAVYPTRQTRNTAAGVVPSSACDLSAGGIGGGGCEPAVSHGCTVHAAAPSSPAGAWLAGVAIVAVVAWRARRRLAHT